MVEFFSRKPGADDPYVDAGTQARCVWRICPAPARAGESGEPASQQTDPHLSGRHSGRRSRPPSGSPPRCSKRVEADFSPRRSWMSFRIRSSRPARSSTSGSGDESEAARRARRSGSRSKFAAEGSRELARRRAGILPPAEKPSGSSMPARKATVWITWCGAATMCGRTRPVSAMSVWSG